jgi:cytoskeletal protein RodZ
MDFGQYLREARERRGVTLRQIAVSTRISLRTLEALENNEIRKLPGGIFSRAFVRTYAHEVGLDPDETVRRFLQQFPVNDVTQGSPLVADVDVRQEDEQDRQRQRTGLLIALAVGLPLVALIVYFAFSSRRAGTAAPGGSGDSPPAASSSVQPGAPAGSPSAQGSSPSSASPSSSSPSGGAAQGGGATTMPSAAQAAASAVTDGLRVVIQPSGACWVRVTADGAVKYQGVLQRGEQQAIDARDAILLEVGDASMFAFTLNGRPGKSLGGPGKVVRAQIRRTSVAEWFASSTP